MQAAPLWQLLNDVRDEIEALYKEGEIGTHAAGRLIVAQGQPRHLAHPDEQERSVEDPDLWRDAAGRSWSLQARYEDRDGVGWHYSGGFAYLPDPQPLLSRDNYRETDVPLCYVQIVVGPLREVRD